METIIQAGNKRIPTESITVEPNPKARESRLFKSIWEHAIKSGSAIVRSYIMYRPYLIFSVMGTILLIGGLVPYLRYGILLIMGRQGDHIQSLLLGAVLLFAAMMSFALTIFSDLMRTNRTLLEDLLERVKKIQYDDKKIYTLHTTKSRHDSNPVNCRKQVSQNIQNTELLTPL